MYIYILSAAALLLLIFGMVYSTLKIHKISFIRKLKNERMAWLISLTPLLFFTIFMFLDSINTVIVFIYFILFLLLGDLLTFLMKKLFKTKIDYTIQILTSFLLTVFYLGYGFFLAHHVVETKYVVETNKDIGVDNFRIVQVSDSHIGATMDGEKFSQYMERINELEPDIVVVTGDFVDDDTNFEDMKKACLGLGKLKTKYGVYFVYGNHDKGYFNTRDFQDKDLREELKQNSVILLEDESVLVADNIYIIGRQDKGMKNRASMKELIKELDKRKYMIVLDHQPNDYEEEEKANVDLVLSGHSHGGQFFPLGPLGVLFGFNDAYYGLEKRGNTTFIVNSGIGDWAIQFKTGTISEYGVIDIKRR